MTIGELLQKIHAIDTLRIRIEKAENYIIKPHHSDDYRDEIRSRKTRLENQLESLLNEEII